MEYDIAVIGAGPAGMMAAIQASKQKANVVLIEKNEFLGVKLLCTGKGRCNITNDTNDIRALVQVYGDNGKFLYSSFNNFGTSDVIEFFEERRVPVEVERGKRVFPKSGKATDVLDVLIKELVDSSVEILVNSKVKKIVKKKGVIKQILLSNNEVIEAKQYIICTGGLSYPKTGSTGDGYIWAKKLGHTVNTTMPALSPVMISEKYIKEIEGLSLKNVDISVWVNNKKIDSRQGEALFTREGLSGPIILDMSKNIQKNIEKKPILKIDFKPALDQSVLDKRIQRDWQDEPNKMYKNSLNKLLPQKIIPIFIKLTNIDPELKVNSITKEQRKLLLHLLKNFELNISQLVGFSKAIITAGGISIKEIDPKTMQSKIIPNLYFAGEVIDVDGPTGGYNLQVCWSTGYTAGISAVKKI